MSSYEEWEKKEEERKKLPLEQPLVDAVKKHANANWGKDGWDYVVECFTDQEIWEKIAGCNSDKQAIKKMASICSLLAERRDDVRSTIW